MNGDFSISLKESLQIKYFLEKTPKGIAGLFVSKYYSWWGKRLFWSFSVVGILLAASPVAGESKSNSVRFAFGVVEGFIEEGKTGVGYELMNSVLSRLRDQGFQVSVSLVPFARLLTGFQNKQYELAFPIVKINRLTLESYQKWGFEEIPLYSKPLYSGGNFVVYTRAESERFNDLQGLLEKDIVVIRGAYIPIELVPPTSFKVSRVSSGSQAFKMLKLDRVDAFLVHEGWGKSILAELDIFGLHHGKSFGDIQGGFIAQNDERGASLIAKIDQIIAEMIKDGTYSSILGRYPNNKLVIRPD